jgi:hypothetical protein
VSPLAAARGLHLIARVALRVARPLNAKRIVDLAGRWVGPLPDVAIAQRVARSINTRGTCLSRALTIAALLPGAQVVIGVDARARSQLLAHAWIEYGGRALDVSEVRGLEIARLGGDMP